MSKTLSLTTVVDIGSRSTKPFNVTLYQKENREISLDAMAAFAKESMLDNVYVTVDADDNLEKHYKVRGIDFKSNSDFSVTKINGKQNVWATGQRYVTGSLARQLTSEYVMPDADSLKYTQQFTTVSIINTIITHALELDSSVTDVEVDLTCLLPVKEAYSPQIDASFKDTMLGEYTIHVAYLDRRVRVSIKSCTILAEGPTGTIPVLYDENGLVEDLKYLEESDSVLIDIGESTTDIAFLFNGVVQSGQIETVYLGGSTLRSYVKDELSVAYPTRKFDERELFTATETSHIRVGMEKQSVEQQVRKAKVRFAKRVYDELIAFMRIKRKDLQQISAIIALGGPTADVVTADGSVKDHLMDLTRIASPNIGIVSSKHAQFLNVIGAVLVTLQ